MNTKIILKTIHEMLNIFEILFDNSI